jgi:DNA adenine methylase
MDTSNLGPFLKWAGGKTQLLPQLTKHMPAQFNRYFEPFVGAGAMLFHLHPEAAVINDINQELINCYRVIRNEPENLIEELYWFKNDESTYYYVREWDRVESIWEDISNVREAAKWRLVKWILSHFPSNYTDYHSLEPYAGAFHITLNKEPGKLETVNDIDHDIINLFRVIREHREEFADSVRFTPYSRYEYESILVSATSQESFIHTGDPLEDARRFLIRCNLAQGAKTADIVGWSHSIATTSPSCTTRWNRLPEMITRITDRLKDVQIENEPAIKLVERFRRPDVLIYADPPYLLSTRSRRLYKNEMTYEEHKELLDVLKQHPGPMYLSGYPHSMYDTELEDWQCEMITVQTEKAKRRVECLWINPVAASKISGKLDLKFS